MAKRDQLSTFLCQTNSVKGLLYAILDHSFLLQLYMNYCEDIMPTLLNITTTFLRDATRFESETVICVQYKENESLVFFFPISTAHPGLNLAAILRSQKWITSKREREMTVDFTYI